MPNTYPMSNIEFVSHLMDRSQNGTLMQVLVIAALDHYSKACLETGPGCLGGASYYINEEAWLRACQELQEALKARLDPANATYRVADQYEEEDD